MSHAVLIANNTMKYVHCQFQVTSKYDLSVLNPN